MNTDTDPGRDTLGAAAEVPKLHQRIVMVFASPVRLGAILRHGAPWFWTLALVAVISFVGLMLVPNEIWLQAAERQLASQPDRAPMGPETVAMLARIGGAVGTIVTTFAGAAIVAGVMYLVFNLGFGHEVSYVQHLAGTAHVFWINLVGLLLIIPIWIASGEMQTALGLGVLLADEPESFGGHLLSYTRVFGVWSSVALGAVESGLSGGRTPVGRGIAVLLALYAVWVVLAALRATLLPG